MTLFVSNDNLERWHNKQLPIVGAFQFQGANKNRIEIDLDDFDVSPVLNTYGQISGRVDKKFKKS